MNDIPQSLQIKSLSYRSSDSSVDFISSVPRLPAGCDAPCPSCAFLGSIGSLALLALRVLRTLQRNFEISNALDQFGDLHVHAPIAIGPRHIWIVGPIQLPLERRKDAIQRLVEVGKLPLGPLLVS
jgi:hypothetical protein